MSINESNSFRRATTNHYTINISYSFPNKSLFGKSDDVLKRILNISFLFNSFAGHQH